jgi:transposase-like protein
VQTLEKAGTPAVTPGMIEPASAKDLFKGRHFDQEIIVLCVRWYLTFKLSSRDLVQMMAERALPWPTPPFFVGCNSTSQILRNATKRYALPVGDSWRVGETYLKVRGQWVTCTVRWIARAARWIFS